MNIDGIFQNIHHVIRQNSPAILSGLAVAGVATTAYLTHRAATKTAVVKMNYAMENEEEIPAKDLVEAVWRDYVPAGAVLITTWACVIAAHAVHQRRQTALISMVALGERALSEYREKTREMVGESKETDIRNEIAKDRVAANPLPENQIVLLSGKEIMCYDIMTDRYFKSDVERIRAAANDVNLECINNMYAPLNMFWTKIGLTALPLGEDLGFNTDNKLELVLSYQGDEEGRPVLALDFRKAPMSTYSSLW